MRKEHKIIDKLSLPKDITENAFVLTAVGNKELYIENYKGILDYTDTFIRIQGKNVSILVEGKHLCITYYTDEDMMIKGDIHKLQYLV